MIDIYIENFLYDFKMQLNDLIYKYNREEHTGWYRYDTNYSFKFENIDKYGILLKFIKRLV